MKPINRKLTVALLFICPTLLLIGILCFNQRRPKEKWINEKPGHRARIDAMVANLKKENLDESMDHLISVSESQQYLYPGYYSGVEGAQVDLEMMLSTRRSIKVLQGIEKLSKTDREMKCVQLFSKALRIHTNVVYTIFKHEDDPSSPLEPQPLLTAR
jgi:hypothetical protein